MFSDVNVESHESTRTVNKLYMYGVAYKRSHCYGITISKKGPRQKALMHGAKKALSQDSFILLTKKHR